MPEILVHVEGVGLRLVITCIVNRSRRNDGRTLIYIKGYIVLQPYGIGKVIAGGKIDCPTPCLCSRIDGIVDSISVNGRPISPGAITPHIVDCLGKRDCLNKRRYLGAGDYLRAGG